MAGIVFLASNGIMLLATQASPHPQNNPLSLANNRKARQIINIFTTLINPATIIAVPAGLAALGFA